MPEQIFIGNFARGLVTSRLPFVINNDAFPYLFNFYVWRGRAKRKRGTVFLGRLEKQIISVTSRTNPWEKGPLVLVAGAGNLISGFGLESTSSITPGSISVVVGANIYTEPVPPDGTLVGAPAGTGTINYSTGAITITGSGVGPLTGTFSYFPGLPVMGLKDFVFATPGGEYSEFAALYPVSLDFDTKYSYQINQTGTPFFYLTSYYKGTNVPFVWAGQDFQQFWTTNYSGALWATNNKAGFHFVQGAYVSGTGTTNITFIFTKNAVAVNYLVVGDKIWFNEWNTGGSTINGITGTVSCTIPICGGNSAIGQYVVTFDTNQTVAGTGIAQLLTNSVPGEDGIKWYDGDPTSGTGIPTGTGLGWVNFSPPLTATSVSLNNDIAGLYYLVGALAILPFRDRLLFFSPQIQTSTGGVIVLQDTVLWSWRGTPYYAAPVPVNQTFDVTAYYVDQTGKGGYLPAGISQPIITVANNEDVLLIGFGGDGRKTRFVYTGNDFNPFLFYSINSELPSTATFSSVVMDKGALDIGIYGLTMTDQQSSARVDLDIPDEIFTIQALNNGMLRVNAVRDFLREWIYFCYPLFGSEWKFPTQTFLFNYRDNTWSILYENFTAQGTFRRANKKTWLTTGFRSWNTWREAWNSGSTSPQFPSIVGGNPQGYVLIKGQGTGEAPSGDIQAIADDGNGFTQITSTNHCVTASNPGTYEGDFLLFLNIIGTDSSLNGQIGKVIRTPDANTFVVDLPFPAGTYLGLGTFTRLAHPWLQTKQFAPYWEQGRKVRLCVQKYLMDFTANGQVTVNISLSQDPDNFWNSPQFNPPPNSLVYSQLMYTCPESTNIGLTPANTNLQMPTAESQFQIWHRFNTSMIGDSVQIGITLSEEQMKNLTFATSEIALHAIHLTVEKSYHLA
jgi:hypothetical protein